MVYKTLFDKTKEIAIYPELISEQANVIIWQIDALLKKQLAKG